MALIGAPLALWVLCLGCGLALERLLRLRLDNALLLPLGLCVAIALIYPGYAAGAGEDLAIGLLLAVALAGFLLAEDGLRARLNPGWPGAAGLAVYVLYMLPVIAYGHWTWVGYDFVNDSAFEMLLASHIQGYGLTLGAIPLTSAQQFLNSYLNTGYPLGTQALLGTVGGLTGTDVAVLYQGFISSMAALGAVALATVARGLLDARRAALAAVAAMAANLTYQYALQGNIKEIGLLAILCAGVALGREAIELGRPYAGAALMAVVAAAAMAAYNAVAVPFLGALALFLGLGLLFVRRSRPSRAWIGPLLVGLGLAGLLAIPSLLSFKTFFSVASTGQSANGTRRDTDPARPAVAGAPAQSTQRRVALRRIPHGDRLPPRGRCSRRSRPWRSYWRSCRVSWSPSASRARGAGDGRHGRPGPVDRVPARESLRAGQALGDL